MPISGKKYRFQHSKKWARNKYFLELLIRVDNIVSSILVEENTHWLSQRVCSHPISWGLHNILPAPDLDYTLVRFLWSLPIMIDHQRMIDITERKAPSTFCQFWEHKYQHWSNVNCKRKCNTACFSHIYSRFEILSVTWHLKHVKILDFGIDN